MREMRSFILSYDTFFDRLRMSGGIQSERGRGEIATALRASQ